MYHHILFRVRVALHYKTGFATFLVGSYIRIVIMTRPPIKFAALGMSVSWAISIASMFIVHWFSFSPSDRIPLSIIGDLLVVVLLLYKHPAAHPSGKLIMTLVTWSHRSLHIPRPTLGLAVKFRLYRSWCHHLSIQFYHLYLLFSFLVSIFVSIRICSDPIPAF